MSANPSRGHVPALSGWHVSSHSNEAGTCVEVVEGSLTGIRDSQHPHLGALLFPTGAWTGFISGVRRTE